MVHGEFFFQPHYWARSFQNQGRPSLQDQMIGSPISHHRTLGCVWEKVYEAAKLKTHRLHLKNYRWKIEKSQMGGSLGFCPIFHPGLCEFEGPKASCCTQVGNLYAIQLFICVCTPALRLYYITFHSRLYTVAFFQRLAVPANCPVNMAHGCNM